MRTGTVHVKMATTTWTDDETLKLINFWGDEVVQVLMEGCSRNRHVYERLARELENAGYKRTWVQCRDKIKKLKGEYKKIKYHNETRRERKVWKFYESIDCIIGTRPAMQPAVVIDTLGEEGAESEKVPKGMETVTIADDCARMWRYQLMLWRAKKLIKR